MSNQGDIAQSSASVATVDTSEFYGRITCCILAPNAKKDEEIAGLIAHIDTHVAEQVAAKDEEIARLKKLVAEQDAMLGKRPCQNNRCSEYAALSAQAAAPVVAARPDRIYLKNCAYLKREAKTTGENGWLLYDERGLARALNVHECEFVDCAIGAAATPSPAPVAMTDEQRKLAESCIHLRGLYHNTHCNPEGFRLEVDALAERARAILAAQKEAV